MIYLQSSHKSVTCEDSNWTTHVSESLSDLKELPQEVQYVGIPAVAWSACLSDFLAFFFFLRFFFL